MKKYIILLWLALIANVVQGQQLVRQVQTLADLANVADGFQSLYNVQYGYTEGDGLGGVFFYDSNGAASTNIFNVIDSNIIAGQWVRSDTSQKELRLSDANNSDYTGFQAPSVLAADVIYTMPSADGAAGYVLSTDGAKTLTWSSAASLSSDTLASIASTKVTSPAIYFDGSNDYIEVADDDKFSFTDGVDDLPFSVSAWIKMDDATDFRIVGKYLTANNTREWNFGTTPTTDTLRLQLRDAAGFSPTINSNAALTSYEGQWIHVAATFGGAGPNSSNAFAAAMTGNSALYINGVAVVASTVADFAGYAGMSNTTAGLRIGYADAAYAEGYIRDVKIFNKELTSTEVAELARGNDLGFTEEWAGANGGIYTQDATPSGEWTAAGGADADEAGPIGGRSNVLKFTADTSTGTHSLQLSSLLTAGKRYRITFDYRIPSAQSNIEGIRVDISSVSAGYVNASPTLDAWNRASFEAVAGTASIFVYATDGGATSFTDAGGDDLMYIDGLTVTEIGTLADFRAENFDSDTGKLYDLSTNAYVGVNNGPTLIGLTIPVYDTGTWTPSITFGGGSTGITYTTQEGHYTRYGNWVSVHAYILLSAKGSDTGTALIAGLPFTARNTAASSHSLTVGNMSNAANLTSAVTAYATDNGTTINLVDWGATGIAVLDDTNFGATTSISVTGIYQIQ